MKKIITLVSSFALSVSFLTGCAGADISNVELSEIELVDGTYRVEFSDYDSLGWKDYIEVTVTDSELSQVVFDSLNEDGELKSEDESYKAQMEAAHIGTYPAKYNQDLINQFIAGESVDSIDVVAGATDATDSFKALATQAMLNAYSGESETSLIENNAN